MFRVIEVELQPRADQEKLVKLTFPPGSLHTPVNTTKGNEFQ